MKKLITIIVALFIIPLFVSAASINTSYDTEKCILTVSGNQEGHEAVASLFDQNGDLIGLKTATINSGNYNTQFVLTYNTETIINITVANEEGNNEINKLDVNIPVCQLSYRTIFSENDDSLTILDPDGTFLKDDSLYVEYLFDFSGLEEDEIAILNNIKSLLGKDQIFAGIMIVGITNNGNEKDIPDTNKGYELLLKLDKETISKFTNPYMSRVLIGAEGINLEAALPMSYDLSKGGVVNKINNIGIYVLYDDQSKSADSDNSKNDKSSENKPNPKTVDNILIWTGIFGISLIGVIISKPKIRKMIKKG